MTHRPYTLSDNQTQSTALAPSQTAPLGYDTTDQTGTLDGSVAGLSRFLRELVEMTGQSIGAQTVPVLELQFGAIFTSTVLSTEQDVASLSITALLPRLERSEYLPLSAAQAAISAVEAGEWEWLWHADAGHYVVVRNIPITAFPDERSVMDAIADTSDQVARWLARMDRALPWMHGEGDVPGQAC
jgi:hypothetical protein